MPGVLYAMRIFLHSVIHDYPPILSYALACRYAWMREAKLASIESLSLNLMTSESRKKLEFASSGAILELLGLHFSRRDLLIAALDNIVQNFQFLNSNYGEPFSINWSDIRSSSSCCAIPAHLRTVLKYRIKEQMEKSPNGQYLRLQEFWDQEEFIRLWEFTCSCSKPIPLVCKERLKSEVLRVLDSLPQSI
ncbi:hypothetical protein DFH11DRAFT_574716 [Phellopilus nigrolimitatus]|nr:hypothetical protein DFH11DRAFT_574716 [Phellopilus nigrolimitatus]